MQQCRSGIAQTIEKIIIVKPTVAMHNEHPPNNLFHACDLHTRVARKEYTCEWLKSWIRNDSMHWDHSRQFGIAFISRSRQSTNFRCQVREVIDIRNADVPCQRTVWIIQISGFIHSTMRRIDFSFLFDNRDIVITRCQRKHFYFSLSGKSPWIPIQCNVTQFFSFVTLLLAAVEPTENIIK